MVPERKCDDNFAMVERSKVRAMCGVELLKDRQRTKDLMSERFML